jgi:hypothetical protein
MARADECQLAQFSQTPCEGRLIRAHLIPRQLFLRVLLPSQAVKAIYDPRSYVLACGGPTGVGGHHGELDHSRTLKIPRWAIPETTEALAAEYELTWWLTREYGPHE